MSTIDNTATAADADIRNLAVKLVLCDEQGQPRRQRLFGLGQLLRHIPSGGTQATAARVATAAAGR